MCGRFSELVMDSSGYAYRRQSPRLAHYHLVCDVHACEVREKYKLRNRGFQGATTTANTIYSACCQFDLMRARARIITLQGCPAARASSKMNCGTCVVLPHLNAQQGRKEMLWKVPHINRHEHTFEGQA
jgi:hypothetical protein